MSIKLTIVRNRLDTASGEEIVLDVAFEPTTKVSTIKFMVSEKTSLDERDYHLVACEPALFLRDG